VEALWRRDVRFLALAGPCIVGPMVHLDSAPVVGTAGCFGTLFALANSCLTLLSHFTENRVVVGVHQESNFRPVLFGPAPASNAYCKDLMNSVWPVYDGCTSMLA
jgi:hypothetical protein